MRETKDTAHEDSRGRSSSAVKAREAGWAPIQQITALQQDRLARCPVNAACTHQHSNFLPRGEMCTDLKSRFMAPAGQQSLPSPSAKATDLQRATTQVTLSQRWPRSICQQHDILTAWTLTLPHSSAVLTRGRTPFNPILSVLSLLQRKYMLAQFALCELSGSAYSWVELGVCERVSGACQGCQ